jgi:hypothetical protein
VADLQRKSRVGDSILDHFVRRALTQSARGRTQKSASGCTSLTWTRSHRQFRLRRASTRRLIPTAQRTPSNGAGSIEVFPDADLAKGRAEYIQGVLKNSGLGGRVRLLTRTCSGAGHGYLQPKQGLRLRGGTRLTGCPCRAGRSSGPQAGPLSGTLPSAAMIRYAVRVRGRGDAPAMPHAQL